MVMASAGDGSQASASFSSTPECRIRRRRRLAPLPVSTAAGSSESAGASAAGPSREKRIRPASPTSSSSATSDVDSDVEQGEEVDEAVEEEELRPLPPAGPLHQVLAAAAAQAAWPVAFGSLSVAGRSRDMEDTVSLRPGFHTWVDGSPMHFFGVFDGHGGSHVSELCRDRMHEFLAEELAAEAASFAQRLSRRQQKAAAGEGTSAAGATTSGGGVQDEEQQQEERAWRAALSRTFRRVDALASLACACGRIASPPCRCPLSGNSGIVGSTAVVAVLVRGRLVVANCGDSRAVLCRGGGPGAATPVPLSDDHKPNRPDELARIQAAGGRVVFNNGHRVRGILAMSRALGDRMLRPEVIAEPEITVTDRTPEDECLILASDGMWDAVPNEIACSVARQCLQDGNPADAAAAGGTGPEPEPRCSNAASLLVRLAFGRDSWDNISVVVIDLQQRE
ncbi:hypothetical protein SEVIR_7G004500v4 [Setaria viridis]|uniref:protein-serine/threonine phosphatase n=1 Tax=Setaria viridis TaxID=4556 RepID=A0A3G2BAL7_SETVI|nr:probable protein phosphatase 2C 37 [Setaria viridis]AYM26706.1 ABA receptor PP2C3.1 [Setaria viridis]TKW03155.1 hypothetical protein SEVIR_7G004500v2 [Setaria viridis]